MKKYTQEFRDSTVDLVINGKNKVIDIARDLDVHHKTLHIWVGNYKKRE